MSRSSALRISRQCLRAVAPFASDVIGIPFRVMADDTDFSEVCRFRSASVDLDVPSEEFGQGKSKYRTIRSSCDQSIFSICYPVTHRFETVARHLCGNLVR